MDEKTAVIVCAPERYEELSRLAREAGLTPLRADAEKAAAAASAGECALVLSDRSCAELERLPARCVLVGEDGRLSVPCEAGALSALAGLACAVHAVALKFSELAARQDEIRRQQARISDFLTVLQDAEAPKELVEELLRLRDESGGYVRALDGLEGALAEARERIDELVREAGRPKTV